MDAKKDNYFENARNLFLADDHEKIINKLKLKYDETFIYLRVLDLTYRINRKTGSIAKSLNKAEFTEDLSHDSALSIFDYLCWSKEERRLSGRWSSLKGMGFSSHVNLFEGKGGIYESGAKKFSGGIEKLETVFLSLKGQKMNTADISYVFELFDGFPLYFQFWDSDEEFPAKFFVLWDENTLQFIHLENSYYILNMLLSRLYELFDKVN